MEESIMIFVRNLIIFIFGGGLVLCSVYFFLFKTDKKKTSFIENVRSYPPVVITTVVAICVFLILITLFPNLIIGMEISDMNLETAFHYHSMITNIVIGFGVAVGVMISIMWSFKPIKGILRRNCMFLGALFIYFIFVMYVVFLWWLNHQIAILN